MSGQLVLIRAFGDKPVVGEVIEDKGDILILARPEHAEAIRTGARPMPMMGFSREDIFDYDVAILNLASEGGIVDWAKCRRYGELGQCASN